MRHIQSFLALILILWPAAGTASDALVRIERSGPGDRDALLSAGVPLILEMPEAFLARGDAAGIAAAAAGAGRVLLVLAADVDGIPLSLLSLPGGISPAGIDACTRVLWQEGEWAVGEGNAAAVRTCLADPDVFVQPLRRRPLGPVRRPPERFAGLADGRAALEPDPLVAEMVAAMTDQRALGHWQAIVGAATTRHSASAGCTTAAEQVHDAFVAYGLEAEYQTHRADHAPSVIGTLRGSVSPEHVWVVIGHLDDMPSSGPAPGADDNASGAAMVVALAEVMSRYCFASTVKFIAVTGEEQGLLGSDHYAEAAAAAGEQIQGVLNGDMIGWAGAGYPAEDLNLNYNPASSWLATTFAQAATDYATGLAVKPVACASLTASDHAPFWSEGYSAVCGITHNEGYCSSTSGDVGPGYPYYHQSTDTIASCGATADQFFGAAVRGYLAAAAHLADPVAAVPDAPTGLTADGVAANRVDLAWSAAEGADTYRVLRAVGGCADPDPPLALGTTTGTSFTDAAASGGVPYAYWVESTSPGGACASEPTSCVEATATGACTEPPRFAGLAAVSDPGGPGCGLAVTWAPPSDVWCGGDVTYSVYRSTDPAFTPSPATLLAAGVTTTSYLDTADLLPLQSYSYVVRAVDGGNGVEDGNTVVLTATPALVEMLADDGTDGLLTLQAPWSAVPTGGVGDGPAYATGLYGHNRCVAATTGGLEVGPGAELRFATRFDIEDGWDKGEVQISTDDGTTWSRLELAYPGSSTRTSDACGLPTGTYFTGASGGWTTHTVPLDAFAGQSIRLRWLLSSDGSVDRAGWWLDDVVVTSPSDCVTNLLFANGFEPDGTAGWSEAVP